MKASSTRQRPVLVLNQFAIPRSQSGGTRHVDLFGRLENWVPLIVAGNRNYNTQQRYVADDDRFRLVSIPSYEGASLVRMLGWGLYAVQAAAVGLRQPRVEAVYASTPHLLAPLAGWAIARLRRTNLIVEVRDLWPESIIGAGALRRGSRLHHVLAGLERWIYHRADHIVVVTPGWEQHFASLDVDLGKVTVVPNGTEPVDFACAEDRTLLRAEFGFTRDTAVYAGAHGPANGLDLLLDAARELPDLDVVLVGSGSEKSRLQQAAANLPNVRFLDPVPKPQLARILAAADFGVHCIEALPVLTSGMSPNKLFDYMAAGLPVVSNAGEGLRTVIRDGEAGRTGASDSLATLLSHLIDADSDQRQTWAATGRRILTERFSRTGAAQTLANVLDDTRATGRTSTQRVETSTP